MISLNVAYYITGHGFGHVTRSLELIRGLMMTGRFRVHVVTNIPRQFFYSELNEFNIDIDKFTTSCAVGSKTSNDDCELSFIHWHRNLDTGGIQKDVIHMDPFLTLDAYYREIHLNRDRLLEFEIDWLKREDIQLILMDATTLACRAGYEAGIKTVFVSNFSWDFIYQESLKDIKQLHMFDDTPDEYKKYEDMIDLCTRDMLLCTYYLRYPGEVPLPAEFDETGRSCRGPLITRQIRNKDLRKELNIPDHLKVLLLGFGGHATEWNLQDHFLPQGWFCLVLRASPEMMPSERFRSLPQNVYVPDLIHASDVVLGKVGYGFVSETISGGTPLVYVPRVYWAEEDFLVSVIRDKYNAALPISLDEFNRGNWEPYIEEAFKLKGTWNIASGDHPDTATGKIISVLDHVMKDL